VQATDGKASPTLGGSPRSAFRTAAPRAMKPCCLTCKVELPPGIASFGNEACRAKEGRTSARQAAPPPGATARLSHGQIAPSPMRWPQGLGGRARETNDGGTTTADGTRISRPDNRSAMTVEGFVGFREYVRRAVRQLDGSPTDVLAAVESHLRGHHELLFAAWDELRHRGAAVTHVPKVEYDRSFDLVDAVVQAKGKDIAALGRDQTTVAKALIALVAQEATAYRASPRR
jgi:hypothetical protein